MNDYDRFIEAFNSLGIKYSTVTAQSEYGVSPYTIKYDGSVTWDTAIYLNNGFGYWDSNCYHYFLDGKYQGHGCWE